MVSRGVAETQKDRNTAYTGLTLCLRASARKTCIQAATLTVCLKRSRRSRAIHLLVISTNKLARFPSRAGRGNLTAESTSVMSVDDERRREHVAANGLTRSRGDTEQSQQLSLGVSRSVGGSFGGIMGRSHGAKNGSKCAWRVSGKDL